MEDFGRHTSKTVQLSTFQGWSLGGKIGYKTAEVKGRTYISLAWCKICARHSDKVLKDHRLKGNAKQEFLKFVEGTRFITKHTITRHLR